MRCEDLTRELASPTGAASPSEIAGHLASCPACADWSRRAAHLDRIWEATRPPEPTGLALDALWASASTALDADSATIPFEKAPLRRGWLRPALALASAAAILAAAASLLRLEGGARPAPGPVEVAVLEPERPAKPETPPSPLKVTVDVGQWATVRIGDGGNEVVYNSEADLSGSSSIPEGTSRDFFNALESLASR